MPDFVVLDRRYHGNVRDGWRKVATYSPEEVEPLTEVPEEILNHYLAHKETLGYASIRGLTKDQLLDLTSLSVGLRGKVRLGQNRWGDIHSYRIEL